VAPQRHDDRSAGRKGVVVGSPTLNNGLFPTVSDFLTYMKGLKPQHKIGAAFGSYGWSGEAPKLISQELQAMQFERSWNRCAASMSHRWIAILCTMWMRRLNIVPKMPLPGKRVKAWKERGL
jgi:hypothetical protein